jgi:hypothetical protein
MGAGAKQKQKYELEEPEEQEEPVLGETTGTADSNTSPPGAVVLARQWYTVPFLKPSPPEGTDLLAAFLKGGGAPLILPRERVYDAGEEKCSPPLVRTSTPVIRASSASLFEDLNVLPSQEECQDDAADDPMPEPLSWRGVAIAPSMEETTSFPPENLDRTSTSSGVSHLNESVGQRHCRFGRCGCSFFTEDPSRSTTCATCSHGEMYHRSSMEAPLCRVQVKGGGTCRQCDLPIVGRDGFSGWYKEVRTGGDFVILHDECYELYKDSNATKCAHCSLPIRKARGFCGRYARIRVSETEEKKKVHKECLGAFTDSFP